MATDSASTILPGAAILMWLDGVYMPPLVLLGVYRLLYSGSCLETHCSGCIIHTFQLVYRRHQLPFSGIWLLLELCIYLISSDFSKKAISHCLRSIARYLTDSDYPAYYAAACCSSLQFLPCEIPTEEHLIFSTLLNFNFTGISPLFCPIMFLALSVKKEVFPCSRNFAITGLIALFCRKSFRKAEDCSGKLRGTFVMILYWEPFCTLCFRCLKRSAASGIVILTWRSSEFFYCRILFYLAFLDKESPFILIQKQCYFCRASAPAASYCERRQCSSASLYYCSDRLFTAAAFSIFTAFYQTAAEPVPLDCFYRRCRPDSGSTAYNTKLRWMNIMFLKMPAINFYSAITQKQISDIQNMDSESVPYFYRLPRRKCFQSNTTSNYDELFAFNYRSISGYTSIPDDNQRDFLEHIGYTKCGENMNITNASVIGAMLFLV